jgi:hypothetical protein
VVRMEGGYLLAEVIADVVAADVAAAAEDIVVDSASVEGGADIAEYGQSAYRILAKM